MYTHHKMSTATDTVIVKAASKYIAFPLPFRIFRHFLKQLVYMKQVQKVSKHSKAEVFFSRMQILQHPKVKL